MTIHIGRRKILVAMGGAAVAWPIKTGLQSAPKERQRIGWLSGSATKVAQSFPGNFLDGVRGFRYVDGRDSEFVPRCAEEFQDRLLGLAQEIISLKPAVIVAAAVNAAVPARAATKEISTICPALADAVHLGLIASEARPGGNVMGIVPYVAGLPAKQIEVAREITPGAKRIGLLTNLHDPKAPPQRYELREAAERLKFTSAEADANSPGLGRLTRQ